MGALLESGRVGNVSLNHLKTVRQDVINRWDSLGLLEGLTGHRKENIAQLYENQASWMLNESTTLGAEGSFETVVFPIVRRVFSKLLANEIVSVQALNLPIGKLFYFVPKIGESQFDSTNAVKSLANSGMNYGVGTGATGGNNMMGMVSGNDFSNNNNLYDGFYGDDGFIDKSKGKYATLTATTFGSGHTFSSTSTSGFAVSSSTGITSGNTGIIKLTFTMGNGFDWENIEDFMSSMVLYSGATTGSTTGNTMDFYFPTQKYGNQLMNSSGEVYVAIPNTGTTTIAITGLTATAKQYASLELADDMGEVSFELKSVTVSVIERKLRAQWSPELAQDVSAFHNIDA